MGSLGAVVGGQVPPSGSEEVSTSWVSSSLSETLGSVPWVRCGYGSVVGRRGVGPEGFRESERDPSASSRFPVMVQVVTEVR